MAFSAPPRDCPVLAFPVHKPPALAKETGPLGKRYQEEPTEDSIEVSGEVVPVLVKKEELTPAPDVDKEFPSMRKSPAPAERLIIK